MDSSRPLVSIYCLTYNHEKYIRDCLDGFVKQKTSFPFEVIVHDDASTDNTQSIIKEYEGKYPDIIKPIYQVENQYSKKTPFIREFIFPRVSGKYIAICEGDDYWTDDQKLQLQVNAMEENPDCHFCVCGVQEVTTDKTPIGVFHPNEEISDSIINPDQFVYYAGKYSFQTSSYLMKYEDWKEYLTNPPAFKKVSDIGDLPMLLYYGTLGNTAYINRVMSCYRRGGASSYSAKKNNWAEDKRIAHFEKQMKVWELFDEYTKRKYHRLCSLKVAQNMFGYQILQKKAGDFLKAENRDFYNSLPLVKKIYILFACIAKNAVKKHYLSTMIGNENKELELWKANRA